ncbi:MAG: hypothetical protein FJZ47_03810 [Candidatus Tectomicrobia bacterium]|uniref:DUF5666 domain-containing protein n=1 Tax=Tectimicrobiota bacterium TaxID=2528274 RepID=A0A938B1C0_UNCTE|nr:hypothetical protein [Candidatus Tectomicrobia bacterium]
MYRHIVRNTTMALGTLLIGSSLVMAAGLQGAVTALDGKGMATVRTSDGKDHQVKSSDGWKVGAKVECESKNNVMECRAGAPQAAVTPAPSSSTTATPAKVAPAPAQPAAPAASAPAAGSTSSTTPAPSTSAPAPASK